MMRQSMTYRRFFRNSVLFLVWLFCLLLLTEISLRALGRLYSRKPSLAETSNNQTFNIVCIGDSFTYGVGVEAAYSYPRQLERMLNNANLNKRFKVFNLAVPGSNSSQHLKCLEDLLGRYKGLDLAIILTGANDRWNLDDSNIYKVMVGGNYRSGLKGVRLKIFLSKLRVYKMLKIVSMNIEGAPPGPKAGPLKQPIRDRDIDEELLKRLLEYNLTEIANLATSNNLGLIFQNYPQGGAKGEGIAERVAGRFNIPFVDNHAAFDERLKVLSYPDLFIYDLSHPNRGGCEIMAKGLHKAIVAMLREKSL